MTEQLGILKLSLMEFNSSKNGDQNNKQVVVIFNNGRTALLKQRFLRGISFFEENVFNKELRVCFINQSIHIDSFMKIMKCLSGFQSSFLRNQEVMSLLEIAKFLNIKNVEKILIEDILLKFQIYNFFIVYQISQKYDVEELKEKCLCELLNSEFQQLNYHRLDLMKCSKGAFKALINIHRYCKQRNKIFGLSQNNITEIIEDYFNFNNQKIDAEIFLTISSQNYLVQVSKYQKIIQSKRKQRWQKFSASSFNLSQLSQSIQFDLSLSQNISPRKRLKKRQTFAAGQAFIEKENIQEHVFSDHGFDKQNKSINSSANDNQDEDGEEGLFFIQFKKKYTNATSINGKQIVSQSTACEISVLQKKQSQKSKIFKMKSIQQYASNMFQKCVLHQSKSMKQY